MKISHFENHYIDEINNIDPDNNYFIQVWDETLRLGIKPQKVLDIGCGTGVFTFYLRKLSKVEMFGADGSKYALAFARKNGYKELKVVRDFNYDKLGWRKSVFDFCLCKDLLEHLVHPENVLREANRVLAPGGHVLVHVPNHFPLLGRLRFLFNNSIDTFHYFPGARRWNFPHVRFYTKQSVCDLAAFCGFKVVADLSRFFPAIPGMGKIPLGKAIGSKLANYSPDQFAEAFTLLMRKND